MLLDWYLRRFSSVRLGKIAPRVLICLRMGLYQLILLDKIPAHAAVDETVALVRRHCHASDRTVSFVNAVLRRAAQAVQDDALPALDCPDKESYYALRYSHPEWLVRLWSKQFGQKMAERICQADNADTPVSVRVNTLRTTPEQAAQELEAAGLTVVPHRAFAEILLCSGGDVAALPAFAAGRVTVQDAASALAAAVADPHPGDRVLDCCAAPGGKSFAMAERMRDGDCVESVLMHYEHGVSVCVSTQVGCRMGCKFCASGQNGLKRHLSAGEILDEILFMQKDSGEKVSNIVLMGTGEPLDNYDNVLKFLHLVSCPEGINIGQRHISLSTSGIADKIERLAGEKLQITLSVSLHAPDDETRSSIMPVNDAYSIERLMQACRYYFDTTGRRISYEYMMADGKTDRPWQAEKLAKLLRGRPGHVNLIPLNEVEESPLRPSRPEAVRRFQQALEKRGITATVRRRLGPDIDAACGQLRRRELQRQ